MHGAAPELIVELSRFRCEIARNSDPLRWGFRTNVGPPLKWFDKAIAADPNYASPYAWRVCSASR